MKVFMTAITLDKNSYDKNPYSLHQLLWPLFPREGSEGRQFLFRATPSLDGSLYILVQSRTRPDLRSFPEGIGKVVECEERPYEFEDNRSYQFVLFGNATTNTDGKRRPIIHAQGLRKWISGKLEGAASIDSVMTIVQPSFVFTKEGVQGRAHCVLFAGFLRVENATQLADIALNGIGPSKFLGLGLMTFNVHYRAHSIREDMVPRVTSV